MIFEKINWGGGAGVNLECKKREGIEIVRYKTYM